MNSNIEHHGHCIPSKERKKPKSPKKKDIKPDFKNANEKLLILRDENIHLKTKKSELEEDVKLIAAKLKRQINTLKKDKILGAGGQLYNKIDEDLDKMIEDNLRLQDEEQQLTMKVRKLQKKRQTLIDTKTEYNKKLRKTTDGIDMTRSRSPTKNSEFIMDVQNYKQHIERSNKIIMELTKEIEMSKRATSGSIAPEELIVQLREKELKVAQQKAKLEDLQDNLKLKYEMFNQNEAFQNSLVAELKQLKQDYLRLSDDNRSFEQQSDLAKQLQQEVEEAQKHRDDLQHQFAQVTRQPFFKREMDQNAFQINNSLQQKSDDLDRLIKESKGNILNIDEETRKLREEERKLKGEKDMYQEEIDKMRLQMDPSNLSLAEIQRRIQELDPSLFRQAMKDLHYDGEEPIWAKFDFLERLKIGPNNQPLDENDPHQLTKEIQRLKTEKRDLAAELDKIQNLLKILVSVDKENQHRHQQEINRLKSLIIAENQKIQELNLLITARSQKLLTITKQGGLTHGQLTAAGLAQLDQELERLRNGAKEDDVLTEFSVITDESEIAPQENYLDLIVARAQFDKQRLASLLGNKELLPGAVHTFISVDFYNHESKPGPVSEGFEPNYSTQFCFKNNIDDFYVQHLEEKCMQVDVFLQRAQKFLKIGSAKLVLSKILEKDLTFQAQEILHEGGELGSTFSIGKIFYKMRMRKPIDEAIKWFQQKTALRRKRDPNTIINQYSQNIEGYAKKKQKAITISVIKCLDLKRPGAQYNSKQMMPFFHYGFFTHQYISPVLQGNNPTFEIQKTYEFEVNDQFFEYMKSQLLKIDFMDESVDLDSNQNDYIGSVRIPLNQLLVHEEFEDILPLIDSTNLETGKVQIRISCKDFTPYPYELNERDLDVQFKMSKFSERDIVIKIAQKFAESNLDIDIIFDMLLENGENMRITKQRFKNYLLHNMSFQEQEIDILLKTNRFIQSKEYIELQDFKNIFEIYYMEARQKLFQEQNDRLRKYQTAQSFMHGQTMGGMQSSNIRNPFMGDTINQRINDTPGFDGTNQGFGTSANKQQEELHKQLTNQSNYSGKAQKELERKSKTLYDTIKQQAYHIINDFKLALPKGQEYAEYDDFRKIIEKYSLDSDEMANFWGAHQIDFKFYYYETLMRISSEKPIDSGAPLLQLEQHQSRLNNPRINYIKQKIQQHLVSQGLNLHDLFAFLDKDKSKTLTIGELTLGMKNYISDQEALELFMAIDQDKSNSISIDELINECSMIHCAYVLEELKKAINTGTNLSIQKIFETVDNDKNGEMDVIEFNEMISLLYSNVEKFEIDALFKHFDVKGTGKVSRDDFKRALSLPMTLENKLKFVLHDFMTPLKTLIQRKKLRPDGLFDKFSIDKKVITIFDFKNLIKYMLCIDLTVEESNLIQSAINGFYGPECNGTLNKSNFNRFILHDFVVKSFAAGNETLARSALLKIRNTNNGKKLDIRKLIQPFIDQMAQSVDNQQPVINIRNMKMFLYCTYSLSTYDIENLIEYMDRDHNGFIGVLDFEKMVELK